MNQQFKIETRSVRHDFTPQEKQALGQQLAQHFSAKQNLLAEFESVKKDYKSREAKVDADLQVTCTAINNGFEMRPSRCILVYRPRDRKKDYYPESDLIADSVEPFPYKYLKPIMTVDMDTTDFQQELLQAESKFDKRKELPLAPAIDGNFVTLAVGNFGEKWYSALRIKVGNKDLDERLDSEQKAFKFREDAVKSAGKRAVKWFRDTFDEQVAKGFEVHINAAVEANKGLVE